MISPGTAGVILSLEIHMLSKYAPCVCSAAVEVVGQRLWLLADFQKDSTALVHLTGCQKLFIQVHKGLSG